MGEVTCACVNRWLAVVSCARVCGGSGVMLPSVCSHGPVTDLVPPHSDETYMQVT